MKLHEMWLRFPAIGGVYREWMVTYQACCRRTSHLAFPPSLGLHLNLKSDPVAYGPGRPGDSLAALESKPHQRASLVGLKYLVF